MPTKVMQTTQHFSGVAGKPLHKTSEKVELKDLRECIVSSLTDTIPAASLLDCSLNLSPASSRDWCRTQYEDVCPRLEMWSSPPFPKWVLGKGLNLTMSFIQRCSTERLNNINITNRKSLISNHVLFPGSSQCSCI